MAGGSPSNRRRRLVTQAEEKLWRLVTRDVAPLPGHELSSDLPEDEQAEPVPSAPPRALPQPAALPQRAAPVALPRLPPPELAHGNVAGIDKRTAERMRRGQMPIEARIDLHGMTQDDAHNALNGFVARSHALGRRCLLVITGKGSRDVGTGVLRKNVPHWLNQRGLRERILAFSYAQPRDGGEGALYVLLKRLR